MSRYKIKDIQPWIHVELPSKSMEEYYDEVAKGWEEDSASMSYPTRTMSEEQKEKCNTPFPWNSHVKCGRSKGHDDTTPGNRGKLANKNEHVAVPEGTDIDEPGGEKIVWNTEDA